MQNSLFRQPKPLLDFFEGEGVDHLFFGEPSFPRYIDPCEIKSELVSGMRIAIDTAA